MVVISPHLDDAVFGCGALLADTPGSTVITVLAGAPAQPLRTDWDRRCGFADARQAIAARRAEDAAALRRLRARPLWLDFLDSQYGDVAQPAAIVAALARHLAALAPQRVLIPLGLFHSDHRLVHAAAWQLHRPRGPGELLAYEDAIYRALPGLLQQRLAELAAGGISATPAPLQAHDADRLKPDAVAAYASQLRALGPERCADLARPERYWSLAPEAPPTSSFSSSAP